MRLLANSVFGRHIFALFGALVHLRLQKRSSNKNEQQLKAQAIELRCTRYTIIEEVAMEHFAVR